MPAAFRMRAIVDRPTRWPTFFKVPGCGCSPTSDSRSPSAPPAYECAPATRCGDHGRCCTSTFVRPTAGAIGEWCRAPPRVATRHSSARPSRWPSSARRRRSWSSRRSRCPPRRTFSTRFSSRRNAIMSSCSRRRQAHSIAKTNWNGDTAEVYFRGADRSWDTTTSFRMDARRLPHFQCVDTVVGESDT